MSYLTNTDVSVRLNINPFCWQYKPVAVYDGPTEIFPSRRTYAFIWLFLHIYLDVDNGKMNLDKVQLGYEIKEEENNENEQQQVGQAISTLGKRSIDLE